MGLVIFGIIRGLAWLWGGNHVVDPAHGWEEDHPDWLLRIYGFNMWPGPEPWRDPAIIAAVLIILVSVLLALIVVRKRSRRPHEAETRVLALGSWALYLPSVLGSVPAVLGIIGLMVTPIIAAGLVPVVSLFLPQDMRVWVSKGVVGVDGYTEFHRSLIAQPLVAIGLALTIIGFVQVFRAHRQKRLQVQGLYATIRHPQHLGIALWTFGLALAASCTAGYIMWFTMTYLYVMLALREEGLLAQQFGGTYDDYRSNTPFMIPLVNIGLPLPKAAIWRFAALIALYIAGMVVLCLIMRDIGVSIPL